MILGDKFGILGVENENFARDSPYFRFVGCDPSPIAPLEGELGSFAGMVNDIVGTGKLGDFLDMVLLVVIGGFGSQLVLGEWGLRFDVIRDFGST